MQDACATKSKILPGRRNMKKQRDQWVSKLGLVMAMAGNAVGLGNFLRFPMQAARYGGGAFMIPYVVAFLLLGLPLMFVEWAMGRFGGSKGQATMPGIFSLIRNNKFFRWLGVLGIWIPLFIASYYVFIESWTLGYSFFSFTQPWGAQPTQESLTKFFTAYTTYSPETSQIFFVSYGIFLVTIAINSYILYRGISKGIEKVAKVMMPTLFIFAIILLIRVVTLGTPNPALPANSIANGFGFLWNPDFSQLGNFSIWLAAAGQVFFTLSLGMGAIACYASYVEKDDDIVASGLTTAMTNETCEVVLGGSIAIPLAVAFFGLAAAKAIAAGSGFGLAFISMPLVFTKLPFGQFFGFAWFGLLFFAGITSSIAMGQIIVAFLEEIAGLSRKHAVMLAMGTVFVLAQFAIFGKGCIDEMDYMAATFGICLFALLEIILWIHFYGMAKSWEELVRGSKIKLWKGILYIMAFISPVYLSVIFVGFLVQDGKKVLFMVGANPQEVGWRWAVRIIMVLIFIIIGWLSTRNMHKTKEKFEVEEAV